MDQCDKEPTSLTLDDYLDLLNLAIRLEDRKWQADIVRTLRHMLEPQGKKQAKSEECTEQELLQCLNQINDRMFALYNELKATDDKDMRGSWTKCGNLKLPGLRFSVKYARYIKQRR